MNYEIKSDEGEVYGPISREEVLSWVAEERVGPGTPVRVEGGEWRVWEDFPELSVAPVAPLGVRLVAFILDNLIFTSLLLLVMVRGVGALPDLSQGLTFSRMVEDPFWIKFNFLTLVAHLLYFTLFHGFWGRTPGKAFFRLRVVSKSGARLTWGAAILRGVSSILSVCYYFGYLIAVFSPDRKTLHDWLAGTRVVREAASRSRTTTPRRQI